MKAAAASAIAFACLDLAYVRVEVFETEVACVPALKTKLIVGVALSSPPGATN